MRQTAQWAAWFASSWRQEAPTKIHSKEIAEDGSLEWHPDFDRWLTDDERSKRTRKVMRRLRRTSIREYEVCYRVIVLREPLADTAQWLNARAVKNGIEYPAYRPDGPHYTRKDALALLIAGITFAREHW